MSIFKRRSPNAVKCSRCGHWFEPGPNAELDLTKVNEGCFSFQCTRCDKWICPTCGNITVLMQGCACGSPAFAVHSVKTD